VLLPLLTPRCRHAAPTAAANVLPPPSRRSATAISVAMLPPPLSYRCHKRQLNEQITDQESLAQTEDKLVAALETSINATTEETEGSL
jgi:hypothetical protein